jgi:glutamate/tyrosine decarboxylase-like PLP-dependent enzyme
VTPRLAPAAIRRRLAERYDFAQPVELSELLPDIADLLRSGIVHVTHPRYFGLFNPSVTPASIVADGLVAAYNPQLAAASHAPAGVELERHVLRFLSAHLGFDPDATLASFTSGGAEANHSAVVTALAARVPGFVADGVRAAPAPPVLVVSSETHDSFRKIAQVTGLGRDAVRVVPAGGDLRLDPRAVRAALRADRAAGLAPFLLVATAGTTAAGVIDPLPGLAEVAGEEGLWLHVDAAWGGAAVLSRRQRRHVAGIELADSVTWDAHKWLSVPMGAGMFFCRHPEQVRRAFGLGATGYMPGAIAGTPDPYATTMQWSRRMIGLKVFMTVAALGEGGLEAMVDVMTEMGERLRRRLVAAGFLIVNVTPLPLVCFTHPRLKRSELAAADVAARVQAAGRAWISSARIGNGKEVLRACITSFRTTEADLDVLVDEVTRAVAG